MPQNFTQELTQACALTHEQIDCYHSQGYIKLKEVFSAELLAFYEKEITSEVMRLYKPNAEKHPNSESEMYQKAFSQIMNIWRESERVKQLVFSKRLARIAADLMRVENVRLYHDQALYKAAHGGITPWHADQYYWPLSTNNTITVWVPLQAVPIEMGPLSFSAGSQNVDMNRGIPISAESEKRIQKQVDESNLFYDSTPYDLGEVSFHSGWTMHNAPENTTDKPRKVMTVIYMESGIRLTKPVNENQEKDWQTWMPGVVVGEVVDTVLNPVLT